MYSVKFFAIVWFVLLLCHSGRAQIISTFESLPLAPNSFWDGSESPGGTSFTDGNAEFPNYFDPGFSYWANGWAYSNMKDSTTAGFTNLFSAITAIGYDGSENYAEATFSATIRLTSAAAGQPVYGFYITNSTYAALSMRDGDAFAKKFGGPSGNDPDWFKVTIHGWHEGILLEDSVDFYLADFRFDNNDMDYILKSWQWVDLTTLGNVDSLMFRLSSSDTGDFGMNTPAFFCIDHFTASDIVSGRVVQSPPSVQFSPNPAAEYLNLQLPASSGDPVQIFITDISGRIVFNDKSTSTSVQIPLVNLATGHYSIMTWDGRHRNIASFIKL